MYILINTINQQVFYVGATENPQRRLLEHKRRLGSTPEMVILETVAFEDAAKTEDFYIDLFKSYGYHLPQRASNYKKIIGNNNPYPIKLGELRAPMEAIAAKEERSLGWMVRKAIQEYLDEYYSEVA